jgi:PIN domain nuclease of toxin-antitoxin system
MTGKRADDRPRHVWVWWVHGDASLPDTYMRIIAEHQADGLGVSAISCWEVAKLVENGRLVFPRTIDEWMTDALAYPGIRWLVLTPQLAIESTRLPMPFHKDPADQIIVATARTYDCALLTLDRRIRAYPHVRVVPST